MIDLSNTKIDNLPIKILFISGGPGCGKGTQCEKLVKYYKFNHLSVGDLMRYELKNNTDEGKELDRYVKSGSLVPTKLTISIIMKGIKKLGKRKYLIDGFPRNLEQAIFFEKMYKPIEQIITFDCPEETLLDRLLYRLSRTPEDQRRPDDNEEIMKKRIKEFFEITKKSTNFYKLLGRSVDISAVEKPNIIFEKIKENLSPTIIYFTGFKNSGYEEKAIQMANKLSWVYIDFKKLIRLHKIESCEEKVEFFKQYLSQCEYKNYIVKDFPETKKQANIYFEHINKPLKVIHIEKTKEELISFNSKTENLNPELKNYFEEKVKLESYFKDKDFYLNLKNDFCLDYLLKSIGFRLFASNLDQNNETLKNFSSNYDFKILDLNEIIESEKKRNEKFEKNLEENYIESACKLLSKCIFSNLVNEKKILISSMTNCIEFHSYFNKNIFNIEFFIEKTVLTDKNIIEFKFEESHYDIISYYYEKNKLIKLHEDNFELIGNFVEKRPNYGFILGPKGCGKTIISKNLVNYGFEIIFFEKFKEDLCKKLGTEDEPLENVNFEQISNELKNLVRIGNKRYLLDGFNYEINEYKQLIEEIGNPSYVIRLNASDETIKKRNSEGEEEEEGNEENLNKIISSYKNYTHFVDEMMNNDYFLDVIDINVNTSEFETLLSLKKLNLKRIIIVRLFDSIKSDENFIKILSAKFNYIFLDLNEIENVNNLELILENQLIKSKNIVLFQNIKDYDYYQNNSFGNNIIFLLNNKIGKVRGLFDINSEQKNAKYEEILERKIVEEVVEEEKKVEDDEEEKNEDMDEGDEEKKEVFDPKKFDWYQINDDFKKLENIFYDLNSQSEIHYFEKTDNYENFEEVFCDLNKKLDEGEDKYVYYQLYK